MEVVSPAGVQLVIDCGTGAYELGKRLLAEAEGPLDGAILISHMHWDHIQGFPFFVPCYVPDFRIEMHVEPKHGRTAKQFHCCLDAVPNVTAHAHVADIQRHKCLGTGTRRVQEREQHENCDDLTRPAD